MTPASSYRRAEPVPALDQRPAQVARPTEASAAPCHVERQLVIERASRARGERR